MKNLIAILCCSLLGWTASAAIVEKTIEYKEGKTVLEGFIAYDDSVSAVQPAVIVVHDWLGLNDFAKEKARELAKMGYVAFAADIYGKGVRPANSQEAAKLATEYKSNRPLLRKRIEAAFSELRSQKFVNKDRIAAIGFCFGGTTALELARTGAKVKSVVSFHGGLDNPAPTGKKITAKVLVLHGADDPFVPAKEVDAFEKEMRDGKIDWAFTSYGGAVHAFMIPDAGSDNSKGAAYNKTASERAWTAMRQWFQETL